MMYKNLNIFLCNSVLIVLTCFNNKKSSNLRYKKEFIYYFIITIILIPQVVEHGNWQVSDLRHRRVIAAAQEGTDAKVAHDDMSQFDSYYFVAPQHYLGKR